MKYLLLFVIAFTFLSRSDAQIIEQETESEFPGGMNAFYQYVSDAIVYPKEALKNHSKGLVFVEFYIDEEGHVNKDSVRIVPAAEMSEVGGEEIAAEITGDKSLEKEALRIIKASPAWIPGKFEGKPRASKVVFPVSFEDVLKKRKTVKPKLRQA